MQNFGLYSTDCGGAIWRAFLKIIMESWIFVEDMKFWLVGWLVGLLFVFFFCLCVVCIICFIRDCCFLFVFLSFFLSFLLCTLVHFFHLVHPIFLGFYRTNLWLYFNMRRLSQEIYLIIIIFSLTEMLVIYLW
jgi:hypothetical protein